MALLLDTYHSEKEAKGQIFRAPLCLEYKLPDNRTHLNMNAEYKVFHHKTGFLLEKKIQG